MSGTTIASLIPLSEHSNDMDHNVTIRPPKRPAPNNYSDRAQARMIRQKLIEQEQEIEDREALRVTTVRSILCAQWFRNSPFVFFYPCSWMPTTPS